MEKWLNQNANAKMLAACTWFQWFYRAFVFFFLLLLWLFKHPYNKILPVVLWYSFPRVCKIRFFASFLLRGEPHRGSNQSDETRYRISPSSKLVTKLQGSVFAFSDLFFFVCYVFYFIFFIPWRLVATPQPHTNTLHNDFVLLMTRTGTKLTFAQLVSQCE